MKAPIDHRVVDNTNQLIDEGFFNVMELKRNNALFVKGIFGKAGLPKTINRKYYPSREDFRQMVYRRKRKIQQDLLDQEYVQKKIKVWQAEQPDDNWLFRPSATIHRTNQEGEDQSFLLVYQSKWQQHLLHRYGRDTVFLDATYKTMKYALPLFFLCVHTNAGYVVVGTFILENEDSASLAEALQVFKGFNPNWTAKNFMLDASEIEATAVTRTFPSE